VTVFARRDEAAAELREWAAEHASSVRLTCVGSAREAVLEAAVVVTALPIGVPGLLLDPAWIRVDVLLLPLDYGTSIGADLAAQGAFYADDVDQLLRYREAGAFDGYRDPDGYCGTAIRQRRPRDWWCARTWATAPPTSWSPTTCCARPWPPGRAPC
jgi:hypothetical protein